MRRALLLACLALAALSHGDSNAPVHVTYLWHLQQPIYWPDLDPLKNNQTYQFAWSSMQLQQAQGGHPESNLGDIFGKDDRVAVYQTRVSDSVGTLLSDHVDAGAQVSYSGCLIENVNSLAGNLNGYSPNWNATYANFIKNQKTSTGAKRLDMVGFTYHHALGPLIDATSLDLEIKIHKLIHAKTWGNQGYSNGFFPAEMAFSERMIPTLVKNGFKWVIVPNSHISRACKDYPFSPAGDNNDPPNLADQVNPAQSRYFNESVSRGCTPNNAYPFSYRPHYAVHVDPNDQKEYRIVVVPAAMAMSWKDGYSCYDTSDMDAIAPVSDPKHPQLVVLAHDGDNAFGGGYSYYMQCVPQLASEAKGKGYHMTTVDTYLEQFPLDDDDVVHVEDGAWINADGDFGSPTFVNWNWPLTDAEGNFNITDGWQLNERNWAVITAAQNWVTTIMESTSVRLDHVQAPQSDSTSAERALHLFLPALTSGYMYYGAVLDMPVKQTVACNNAIEEARNVKLVDETSGPSIFALQRLPYNPGGCGAGSLWHYKYTSMPNSFFVWTFVHDISGVDSVTIHVSSARSDEQVGSETWKSLPMTMREFPAANVYNSSSIDFFVMPEEIANEYYIELTGYKNEMVQYYVSATDKRGNTRQSDTYRVYVGDGEGPCDQGDRDREQPPHA